MPPQLRIIEIMGHSVDDKTAGACVGQVFVLIKDRLIFGRDGANDIPLHSFDRCREHGQLLKLGEDYCIEQFNGTYFPILVNGEPVEGRVRLRHGDVISVFRVKLAYERPESSQT